MFAKLTKYLDDLQPPTLDFNSPELTEPTIEMDELGDEENTLSILGRIAEKLNDPEYTKIDLSKLHFINSKHYFGLMFQLAKHSKKCSFSQNELPRIPSVRLTPQELSIQLKYLSGLTKSFDFLTGIMPMQFSLGDYLQLLRHLKEKPVRKLHLPPFPSGIGKTPEFFNILADTLASLSLLEELILPHGIRFRNLGFLAFLIVNKNLKSLTLNQIKCDEDITSEELLNFLNNLPPIHHVDLGGQEFLYKVTQEETIRLYFNWLHQKAPFTIVQIYYLLNLEVFEQYFGEFLSKPAPPKNIRKIYLDSYGHNPNPSEFYNKYIVTSHCWIFKQFSGGKQVPWHPINLPLATVNDFIMRAPSNIQRNLQNTYLNPLPPDILKLLDDYYRYQDESFVFDPKVIQAVRAGCFLLQLKTALLNDFGAQLSAQSTLSSFFAVDLKQVTAALKIIDTPRDLFHWQAVFCELAALFAGKTDWTDRLASLALDSLTKIKFQGYATSLEESYKELDLFLVQILPPTTKSAKI